MSGPRAVLVGPPGAGKSTVGPLVADALGLVFLDTDTIVEDAAGKTVSDIFVDDGEPAFRALERDAVSAALAGFAGVLALGGGAVLDPATQQRLADPAVAARVVLLDVGLGDAVKRVGLDRDRPLLLGSPRAQLRRLLEDRRPVYTAVAGHVVGTDGRLPADVAADVLAALDGTPR